LTAVLIYKISKYYTKKEMHRILLVITYGFGSLAFHYSLVFLGYVSGVFFIFLAFYLLLKSRRENLDKSKYFLLAGVLAGFSIVIEISNVLIAGLLFLYLLILFKGKWKKSVPMFLVGGFIGILPFLLYNFLAFGNPIDLPRNHMDPAIWKNLQEGIGIRFNPSYNLHVILRLLVFPYKGLFIYFPVLILSLPGLFFMYKKNRKDVVFILTIFLSVLFLASMWWAWWHGAVFGPRLLMSMIPFLMIPILFTFKKISLKIVLLLLIISVLTNLIGLQSNYEDLLKDLNSSEMLPEYQERFDNFQVLEDPLMGYYLPRFLEFGPRSRIFESLLYNPKKMIDIRGSTSMRRQNIPFMSLVPLTVVFLLIWKNDIKEFKKRIRFV
jgi:MFS family permease